MKKFFSTLSSTLYGGVRVGLLFLALLTASSLWAYDFQSGDLYYNVSITNRHNVWVTYRNHAIYSDNYDGYEGLTNIIIPETVTNDTITYRVTGINSHAFEDCSSLTSISIPNSVTYIGNSAFYDCSSLESITIPNSVTSIESYTFAGCSSLTSINIPNSVTSIYGRAFENCSSLKSITIPNSVTSIYGYAFRNCSSLNSITIPNSVTSIGGSAFYNCSSLNSITLPNSVTSIGESAFCLCSSLESITLPNAITSIGYAVFYKCSSLTSINIPNSVTSIGGNAFYECSSLNSITIPNSVTSIGGSAFRNCSSLTSATIGNSVTRIEPYTFAGCSSLTSATIGNSVTSIENSAFYNCSSLTSITIPHSVTSIGEYAFYNCSSLNSITIPNSVTSIGEYAFGKCSGLTLVTIGDGLTSIGAKAFYYCKNIEEIYCYPITPPAVESSSFYNYNKATLYVPCDSREVYKEHPIFGKFEKIKGIEGCGEYVTTHIYDTICQGDVYEFGEYLCDTTGTYTAFIDLVPTYLHLTVLPRIIDTITIQVCDSYEWHGKVYTESGVYTYRNPYNPCVIEELQLTIIDTPTPPEPEIPTEGIGVFSVGEEKTVTFSPGNLQYHPANDEWRFADNQADYVGNANSNISATYNGWIDLFGWGTGDAPTKSDTYPDEYKTFVDWGTNKIGDDAPNTWRTLSSDEWMYILYNRPNAQSLFALGSVNGVNGIIILPDNWTSPADISFINGLSWVGEYYYNYDNNFSHNTYTSEQWVKMEQAGAVFLPLSGCRWGADLDIGTSSNYWSSTEDDKFYAYNVLFYSVYLNPKRSNLRSYGYSVRLVKDISNTTPEPPVEPETEEIFIYQPVDSVTICASELPYIWRGMRYTEAGTYTYAEIAEDENYIYHNIYTLDLSVIPSERVVLVEEAYDSYEWHGVVYTESGVYFYEEYCYQEILELTIIPSEDKEYVYEHHNYLVCDADIFVDPITGSTHVISSLIPFSLTWSDTIIGTNIDTIHTFNITPIVYPEPLTEDMLYAIGAVPKLVAGEKVDLMGTTELIMAYYQMHDQHDIADVIGVEWVAGHDVVLDAEQTTHTMVLEVWDECDDIIPVEFTFPVSKKDSEPQDTTIYIYHPTEICEGETYIWRGMEFTETGTYTSEEIVEDENYIYHIIYTLDLTVIAPMILVWPVEAYDSYEWHGEVYTESGTYIYEEHCYQEILHLTIIDNPSQPQDTTIYYLEQGIICEGDVFEWYSYEFGYYFGSYSDEGTYEYVLIEETEEYIYHHIFTLVLTVEPRQTTIFEVEAEESYEWHGVVYTESGVYTYEEWCHQEILELTIIPSTETAVDNMQTDSDHSAQKILRDGQLYIYHNGSAYTIMGQKVSENF